MDSDGAFHEVEKDGKRFMVYHHPKYFPIPQLKSSSSSPEGASHDHFPQPLFLCPNARFLKDISKDYSPFLFKTPPEYVPSTTKVLFGIQIKRTFVNHYVLPIFWCNNKNFNANGDCGKCSDSNFGTDYYFCEYCDQTYHKECVESPLKIKHPYHLEHSLQLYYHISVDKCLYCRRRANHLVYSCTICQVFMHPICAMRVISLVIDKPKRHDHPLYFFPRQASLTCDICGWLKKTFPTYICLRCYFVAHDDCMYSPHIIKISRHHHRLSYIHPLPSRQWSCGVCHKKFNGGYGAYACEKCSDYVVHSRCALQKDVWDGEELEGVPEYDDIAQDDGPFLMISEGLILHFLHDHHLRLEVSIHYDENKFCTSCVLPIFEGSFYTCMECDFILHESCAKLRRRIQHVLHPHPLTLNPMDQKNVGHYVCDACVHYLAGFIYGCHIGECNFQIDVRCASISEPFDIKGHEHPLFIGLDPKVKPVCHMCKTQCRHKPLNCIECYFIVCFKCATLPYIARYKHEKHFLTILWGKEACEKDWCELCERNSKETSTKVIYWCNECCTTFHMECLIGEDLYLKHGDFFELFGNRKFQILGTNSFSRPLCDYCKNPCKGKIVKADSHTACSMKCAYELSF